MTLTSLFTTTLTTIEPRLVTDTIYWNGSSFHGTVKVRISEAEPITIRVKGTIKMVGDKGIDLTRPINDQTLIKPTGIEVIQTDTGLPLLTALEMIQTQQIDNQQSGPVDMTKTYEQTVNDWALAAYRSHLQDFLNGALQVNESA